mmetsp:Transcript_28706/g.78973  ORF Transcript_28706/g.78973 Transcript_28706/m.78973 type:complete len:1124 (-) Transcript_28706:66-3437(-)
MRPRRCTGPEAARGLAAALAPFVFLGITLLDLLPCASATSAPRTRWTKPLAVSCNPVAAVAAAAAIATKADDATSELCGLVLLQVHAAAAPGAGGEDDPEQNVARRNVSLLGITAESASRSGSTGRSLSSLGLQALRSLRSSATSRLAAGLRANRALAASNSAVEAEVGKLRRALATGSRKKRKLRAAGQNLLLGLCETGDKASAEAGRADAGGEAPLDSGAENFGGPRAVDEEVPLEDSNGFGDFRSKQTVESPLAFLQEAASTGAERAGVVRLDRSGAYLRDLARLDSAAEGVEAKRRVLLARGGELNKTMASLLQRRDADEAILARLQRENGEVQAFRHQITELEEQATASGQASEEMHENIANVHKLLNAAETRWRESFDAKVRMSKERSARASVEAHRPIELVELEQQLSSIRNGRGDGEAVAEAPDEGMTSFLNTLVPRIGDDCADRLRAKVDRGVAIVAKGHANARKRLALAELQVRVGEVAEKFERDTESVQSQGHIVGRVGEIEALATANAKAAIEVETIRGDIKKLQEQVRSLRREHADSSGRLSSAAGEGSDPQRGLHLRSLQENATKFRAKRDRIKRRLKKMFRFSESEVGSKRRRALRDEQASLSSEREALLNIQAALHEVASHLEAEREDRIPQQTPTETQEREDVSEEEQEDEAQPEDNVAPGGQQGKPEEEDTSEEVEALGETPPHRLEKEGEDRLQGSRRQDEPGEEREGRRWEREQRQRGEKRRGAKVRLSLLPLSSSTSLMTPEETYVPKASMVPGGAFGEAMGATWDSLSPASWYFRVLLGFGAVLVLVFRELGLLSFFTCGRPCCSRARKSEQAAASTIRLPASRTKFYSNAPVMCGDKTGKGRRTSTPAPPPPPQAPECSIAATSAEHGDGANGCDALPSAVFDDDVATSISRQQRNASRSSLTSSPSADMADAAEQEFHLERPLANDAIPATPPLPTFRDAMAAWRHEGERCGTPTCWHFADDEIPGTPPLPSFSQELRKKVASSSTAMAMVAATASGATEMEKAEPSGPVPQVRSPRQEALHSDSAIVGASIHQWPIRVDIHGARRSVGACSVEACAGDDDDGCASQNSDDSCVSGGSLMAQYDALDLAAQACDDPYRR